MKKFCNSQVSVVTFYVGWASGLQFVFFSDNIIIRSMCCWKWLLWISQGKVATSDRWGGLICHILHGRFSYDLTCEKSLKSVNFWVIQKIKGGRFGDKVYIPESTLDILFGLNYPHQLRPLRSELVNCRKVYCWVWVSVNIWQSYKQERGCLMHFACLSNALQKAKKVHETIAFLLVTLPNIHRFLTFFHSQTHK